MNNSFDLDNIDLESIKSNHLGNITKVNSPSMDGENLEAEAGPGHADGNLETEDKQVVGDLTQEKMGTLEAPNNPDATVVSESGAMGDIDDENIGFCTDFPVTESGALVTSLAENMLRTIVGDAVLVSGDMKHEDDQSGASKEVSDIGASADAQECTSSGHSTYRTEGKPSDMETDVLISETTESIAKEYSFSIDNMTTGVDTLIEDQPELGYDQNQRPASRVETVIHVSDGGTKIEEETVITEIGIGDGGQEKMTKIHSSVDQEAGTITMPEFEDGSFRVQRAMMSEYEYEDVSISACRSAFMTELMTNSDSQIAENMETQSVKSDLSLREVLPDTASETGDQAGLHEELLGIGKEGSDGIPECLDAGSSGRRSRVGSVTSQGSRQDTSTSLTNVVRTSRPSSAASYTIKEPAVNEPDTQSGRGSRVGSERGSRSGSLASGRISESEIRDFAGSQSDSEHKSKNIQENKEMPVAPGSIIGSEGSERGSEGGMKGSEGSRRSSHESRQGATGVVEAMQVELESHVIDENRAATGDNMKLNLMDSSTYRVSDDGVFNGIEASQGQSIGMISESTMISTYVSGRPGSASSQRSIKRERPDSGKSNASDEVGSQKESSPLQISGTTVTVASHITDRPTSASSYTDRPDSGRSHSRPSSAKRSRPNSGKSDGSMGRPGSVRSHTGSTRSQASQAEQPGSANSQASQAERPGSANSQASHTSKQGGVKGQTTPSERPGSAASKGSVSGSQVDLIERPPSSRSQRSQSSIDRPGSRQSEVERPSSVNSQTERPTSARSQTGRPSSRQSQKSEAGSITSVRSNRSSQKSDQPQSARSDVLDGKMRDNTSGSRRTSSGSVKSKNGSERAPSRTSSVKSKESVTESGRGSRSSSIGSQKKVVMESHGENMESNNTVETGQSLAADDEKQAYLSDITPLEHEHKENASFVEGQVDEMITRSATVVDELRAEDGILREGVKPDSSESQDLIEGIKQSEMDLDRVMQRMKEEEKRVSVTTGARPKQKSLESTRAMASTLVYTESSDRMETDVIVETYDKGI